MDQSRGDTGRTGRGRPAFLRLHHTAMSTTQCWNPRTFRADGPQVAAPTVTAHIVTGLCSITEATVFATRAIHRGTDRAHCPHRARHRRSPGQSQGLDEGAGRAGVRTQPATHRGRAEGVDDPAAIKCRQILADNQHGRSVAH